MPSVRSLGYECMNGDNGDGWYTGEGALYLYTPSGFDEYSPAWWKNADKHLIPGTTVDERAREIMFFNQAWRCHRDFVGGVSLSGKFMTASMDYEAFHNEIDEGRPDTGYGRSLPIYKCTLTAKKSWFFFDRAILCLGCDVDAHDGYAVRTVVENRALGNDAYIVADCQKIDFAEGEFHIEAKRIFVPNAGGFIFPNGGKITVRFYERSNLRFVAIWLDHGIDPKGEEYAYIILPGASEHTTAAYDTSDVEILYNDGKIQSAKERSSNLCGIIFRDEGELCGIRADQPMIAMLESDESGNISSLSVTEPTQKRAYFSFEIEGGASLSSDDTCIESAKENGKSRFTVNCDSAKGRAYTLLSV